MANGDTSNQAWYAKLIRPGYQIIGGVILLANYTLPPVASLFDKEVKQADIPETLLWVIAVNFLGYVGMRTVERMGAIPFFAKLNGNSK